MYRFYRNEIPRKIWAEALQEEEVDCAQKRNFRSLVIEVRLVYIMERFTEMRSAARDGLKVMKAINSANGSTEKY